jgi:putative transposase
VLTPQGLEILLALAVASVGKTRPAPALGRDRPHGQKPSPGWRIFLKQHAGEIWACDFIDVQTILVRTLYVFFVVRHASREVVHVQVTQHPTAEWAAQQIVECCGWDHKPPRFLRRAKANRR